MSSLRKFAPGTNWRVVAAAACVTLAGDPSLAAVRHHTPHASQAAPSGPAGGASVPAGQAKTEQAKPEAGDTSVDTAVSKTTPNGRPDRGGKAADGKSVGPIDLTRPDDGYGNHDNLRRRAARMLLIAAQKKRQAMPATTIAPHPPAPAAGVQPRNAAGVAVPAVPTTLGAAKAEPAHAEPLSATALGGARNNLGLSPTEMHVAPVHIATTPASPKPPVPGINGTSLHQAGPGIGGPAKDHAAIAGSSYRHK